MKHAQQVLIFLVIGLVLAGCSSSTPSLNVNNDFWFGTVTQAGNPKTSYAGVGFKQSGTSIEAALVVSNGTTETACCVLLGSLDNKKLDVTYKDAANDDVFILGEFSDNGKEFSGTLRFVVDGVQQDFDLKMSYQKELDAALRASLLGPSTLHIQEVKSLLE
jgi:hypothetical protein